MHSICRREYEDALETRLQQLEALPAAVRALAHRGSPDLAQQIARQLDAL